MDNEAVWTNKTVRPDPKADLCTICADRCRTVSRRKGREVLCPESGRCPGFVPVHTERR